MKRMVWKIRINKLVIQFATKELAMQYKKPDGLPGTMYMFLAPFNREQDFIKR